MEGGGAAEAVGGAHGQAQGPVQAHAVLDQVNKCKALLLSLKDKRSGAMRRPKVSTREECQAILLTPPVRHRP